MNMIDILKEVGRGKRGARDLTYEEACYAAEQILTKKATPAQIGAFFLAERIKMENVDELYAFITICRKYAQRSQVQAGIDCAGPYDGRATSFMATFATSFVLASAGLPVTLHGTASLPPKWGVTVYDLLSERSKIPPTRSLSLHAAELTNVLFVSAEEWCPPLKELRPIREELGLRTTLNTIEKLIDYSYSPYLVYGVYHNTVFDRMSQLIMQLGYRKALIVQGPEGSEDVYINRPTRTYVVEGDKAELQIIDPELYGLDATPPEVHWTAAEQLRTAEQVLTGEAHIAFIHQVILNGAVRLHIAEKVDSIEEGIYTCKALLEEGAPYAIYQKWLSAMTHHSPEQTVANGSSYSG
ncbi:Anthranilate phosphoribosyltransferase [compost metagenome]